MSVYDEKPWLKHYGNVPPEIAQPLRPLTNVIERWKDCDDRTAVVLEDRTISYPVLWSMVNRVAEGLRRLGVQKGDRVAIILPNSLAFLQAYFGILRLGAVVVALNPLYTSSELAALLMDAAPRALIVPPQAVDRLPSGLPWPVCIADMNNDQAVEEKACTAYPQASSFSAWLSLPELATPPEIEPEHDLALLQYTGGTTGLPKGAMLSHGNLWANAEQSRLWMQDIVSADHQDTILIALPLFHAYGMTVGMNLGLLIGARLVFMVRFHPEQAAFWIERTKPTLFPGAPTMYVALVQYAAQHHLDLTSIKGCISGSAPLPAQVQEDFEKLTKGRIVEGYGLTEASPVTHCQPLWPVDVKSPGIGFPYPSTSVRIVNASGDDVPVGEKGELLVKGPQVMQGYWNRPEESQMVLKEGWLYTGDVATMDEDGYFHIADRKKDLIICSGFNVYPREVEEVLYQYPGIEEACVIGVPDPYRGETVKAVIVPRAGVALDARALDAFCQERLVSYKRPRIYEMVDHLPKSAIGKILRRELSRTAAQNDQKIGGKEKT
ncbi:MAG: long-chain fatty acid--CoA ligase [Sulfobacillus thermotolerans]|nr:long-chain fatty acid--CoA ligase [Sulfobacillus thermotolerans]